MTRSGDPTGAGGSGATTEFIQARPTREPAPEASFAFEARPLASSELRVVAGDLRESLSELYEAVLELCTPEPTLGVDALLGERAVLQIARGPRRRRLCGIVRRVERLDSWGERRRARLHLVPALWALTQRTDCRIFQEKTTVQIVRAVYEAAHLDPAGLELDLRKEYPRREYCVQYRETDLAFVMRLLEDEGIAFYFRHDGDAEVLVLTDAPSWKVVPTLDRRPVPFAPPQAEAAPVEVVQRFDAAQELCSTGVTLRDYDFTRPSAELDLTRTHPRGDGGARARYDYADGYTHGDYDDGTRVYGSHDGARRVELRHRERVARERLARGTGNVTGFQPGRAFELIGHEHADLDQRYLVTRVEHQLRAPEELFVGGDEPTPSGQDRYRNTFECVPASVEWVPARQTPRPRMLAAQTATVVGPAGEEVHVDAHGRIKVQFHWDREGQRNETSSCWVRVAQAWAGAQWGALFIPRIGMEVVVQFLEGDPDRPLVTGCVYNGQNRPPYELPDEKTRSTLKTSSSLGGSGYNELRFEDKAGAEEVFLHAQRDLNTVVEHDRETVVHHDERALVDGDRTRMVKGHEKITVVKDMVVHVLGNYSLTVEKGDAEPAEGGPPPPPATPQSAPSAAPDTGAPAAPAPAAPAQDPAQDPAPTPPAAAQTPAAVQKMTELASNPAARDAMARVFSNPQAAQAVGTLLADPRVTRSLAATEDAGALEQVLTTLAATAGEAALAGALQTLGGPTAASWAAMGIHAVRQVAALASTPPAPTQGQTPSGGGHD